MTDDQGWYDVGFNGNLEIQTPWTDSLATLGVIFDRFYSASAVCSPTRASVITGRNPLRINIPYANTGHILDEEITIPEILGKDGYVTGHYGKWHLGTFTRDSIDSNRGGRAEFHDDYSIPTSHGYDEFFCSESKVPTFDPMVYPRSFLPGESKHFGWRSVENNDTTYSYGTAYWKAEHEIELENIRGDNSRIIMDRVIPFIENAINVDKPFFTTIWFHTPHLPVVADSVHRNMYPEMDLKKQIYYGSLSAMDEQIGRLWQKLNQTGIQEETIIFFCSDNGPERNTPGQAGIFRDRKRSLYEGGIRVPAFMVWKNKIKGGRRLAFPSVTSDYMPTILDVLNIDFQDDRPMDGVSLMDAILRDVEERTKPIGFISRPNLSWVTNQYKLISTNNGKDFELYDLLNDPSEKENIIEAHPKIAVEMKNDFQSWSKSVKQSAKGKDYE